MIIQLLDILRCGLSWFAPQALTKAFETSLLSLGYTMSIKSGNTQNGSSASANSARIIISFY